MVQETEPRRRKRARVEKSFGDDFVTWQKNEPLMYVEAVSYYEGPLRKAVINSEADSILQNHTQEIIYIPPGCKPLGSKWILRGK